MACRCGKTTRVPRARVDAAIAKQGAPAGDHWWFAVPPDGSGLEAAMFRTLYEARAAARAGGYGWKVESRKVVPDDGL